MIQMHMLYGSVVDPRFKVRIGLNRSKNRAKNWSRISKNQDFMNFRIFMGPLSGFTPVFAIGSFLLVLYWQLHRFFSQMVNNTKYTYDDCPNKIHVREY